VALGRIATAARQSFADWMTVGRALVELQELALNISGANEPVGRAYNAAYAGLIEDTPRLAKLDKGTVSRARWVYQNREAVEEWHGNITDSNLRNEINHPRVVKERFEKFLRDQEAEVGDADDAAAKQRKPKKPTANDMLIEQLNRDLDAAHAYIAELEGSVERLEGENKDLLAKLVRVWSSPEIEAPKIETTKQPAGDKTPRQPKPNAQPPARGPRAKYPWGDLAVGESFTVEIKPGDDPSKTQASLSSVSIGWARRHNGEKFRVNRVEGGSKLMATRTA
jgi:hypothetical protein